MRAHLLSGDDQVVVLQLEVDDVVFKCCLREAAVFRGHVHHDRDLAGVAMDERGWRSAAREQIPREQQLRNVRSRLPVAFTRNAGCGW